MTKKRIIRSVNDLPDWYDLKKYEILQSLKVRDWYQLLLQRYSHIIFYKSSKGATHRKGEHMRLSLDALRRSPTKFQDDPTHGFIIAGGQFGAFVEDPHEVARFTLGIQPLTIRRLYQTERRLKDRSRLRLRKILDMFYDDFSSITVDRAFKTDAKWATSFIDDPIIQAIEKQGKKNEDLYLKQKELVEINLALPDKILIQQFSQYLKYAREMQPQTRQASNFKHPELKKWVEYSVLPYIDLKFWATENNVSIPNRVIADAIFSDGEKGEEMVRKTTKKIADMLMSSEYINFLPTIMAQDYLEKK